MMYLKVFAVGGLICAAGQLLLIYTRLGSAKILVLFVTLGVFLSALGLYQPLVDFAGAGATVPLPGFGHLLAKGALEAVREDGLAGALTGGTAAAAGGIAAAIALGYAVALLFTPKTKE
ncbi:MAG: SpoVA/SpoVAEb family sporulation membrane protein [Christensenellaceae bacterium]|nr:SpoVA/SpoVAEb family sporulation membrane protein [Christensenellaceae bacterium]